MRKTMITMATVALSAGLFAGTSFAGGDGGVGNGGNASFVQKSCPSNANNVLPGAILGGALGSFSSPNAAAVNC
jgi:hypothetical protein